MATVSHTKHNHRRKKGIQQKLKKTSPKEMFGIILLVLLVVGGLSAMVLVKSSSDLRNQASVKTYDKTCTSAAQCPSGQKCNSSTKKCYTPSSPTKKPGTITPTTNPDPTTKPIGNSKVCNNKAGCRVKVEARR